MAQTGLIPEPVTLGRVRERLVSKKVHVLQDGEGDLGLFLFPHFYFLVQEKEKPFVVTSTYHRQFPIDLMERCSAVAQQYNRQYYTPKLTTEVSDSGLVLFHISHCFNWFTEATDKQIDEELETFIRAAVACFTGLDGEFPDRWEER